MTTIHSKISNHYGNFKNSEAIDHHPAWYGRLQDNEVENLLKGQPKYTYLLRSSDLPDQFLLSYIQSDLSLGHHAIGRLDRYWFFLNGDVHRSASFLTLIPEIMHCSSEQCRPLIKSSESDIYSHEQ